MRIVAGDLRRRKLLANPGQNTRPITDRAKVKLFDHIRDLLPGKRVLDVYSGTGSLGFEALSRGAKSVVCCEQDHRAHELLIQNATALQVTEKTLCWRVDCLRCSFKAQGDAGWFPYDVVFFDPPYAMIKKLKRGSPLYRSLLRLTKDDLTTPNALMVLRTPTESEFDLPENWVPFRVLNSGGMDMHLLRKESIASEELPPEPDLDADSDDPPVTEEGEAQG
jgi:16S rRNA (guanine966-N2)-methyltransferase